MCSTGRKDFIENLIERAYEEVHQEQLSFSRIVGEASQLNNYIISDMRLGKFIEKLLINVKFNDRYTLERINFIGDVRGGHFKGEKFILFLYLIFALAEDTKTNNIKTCHTFKLKGLRVENILSKWCEKYMVYNSGPVFQSIRVFFEYSDHHYIQLNPESRSRFLEKGIHNDGRKFKDNFHLIDSDLQGIKNLYERF